MSERKMEIENRLKYEKSQRSSTEKSDIEEKQRTSDSEVPAVIRRQDSQQRDLAKSVNDENDGVEPTSLTFEMKRLSFERGISIDKLVLEEEKTIQEEKAKTDPRTNVENEFIKEKKSSTSADKRLSLEQNTTFQECKEQPPPQRSAEDKRRDSELLEGVSFGLGKLEAERSVAHQCRF